MASVKTRNGNPHHRFASLQTPLLCNHKKTEGLKAPGYSYSRLSDVFSLITQRSSLTTQSYILPSIEGGANKAVRGLTECQSEPQRGEHSPLCDGGRGVGLLPRQSPFIIIVLARVGIGIGRRFRIWRGFGFGCCARLRVG